jgi:hypothetical protein
LAPARSRPCDKLSHPLVCDELTQRTRALGWQSSAMRTLFPLLLAGLLACSSSKNYGGPVAGPVDNHCFQLPDGGWPGGPMFAQPTSAAACHPDGGGLDDAGLASYGDTMFNSGGNDDDCKYVLSWSATPIAQEENVFFSVAVVNAVDGTPATGANAYAEVFLPSQNHISPSTNPPVTESSPGVYAIGPVIFDLPGQWTVRFHFYQDCLDLLADSPHGHAAYFVNVP